MDMLTAVHDWMFNKARDLSLGQFKEGNIQSLTATEYAPRRGLSEADLPEFKMMIAAIRGPQSASSSHYNAEIDFQVMVTSGSLAQGKSNLLFCWLLELVIWLDCNKGIFLWKDKPIVTNVVFTTATSGLKDTDANRNIDGFSTLTSITVKTRIPHSIRLLDDRTT